MRARVETNRRIWSRDGESRYDATSSPGKFRLKLRFSRPRGFKPVVQVDPAKGKPGVRAFTMIEIAISLAVIGFALVAIIGILPAGMNVQKENRQETIITQDASVLLNAIRNGERGIDDLTNYVYAISNYGGIIQLNGALTSDPAWYTYNGSSHDYPITNGLRIVGLLSSPRYTPIPNSQNYRSNYVIALVRSMSGLASEKFPQSNPDMQDFALRYRMFVEVLPAYTNHFDSSWTNFGILDRNSPTWTNDFLRVSNIWMRARNAEVNFHDLRLTFRWPYPGSPEASKRQVFRTSAAGMIFATNEPGFNQPQQRLFFLDPRSYVQVKP